MLQERGPGGGVAPGGPADPDAGVRRYAGRALGSALRFTVRFAAGEVPASAAAADAAWEAVCDEFAAVDVALSRFRDDSELTRLNRLAGGDEVVRVSSRLRQMLAIADRAGRLTDGRFDPSVLEVLERIGERGANLAGHAGREPRSPAWHGMTGQPAAGGASSGSLVRVPRAPVDSGGIGKGLALRWARDRALSRLPPGAGLLLEAGGDLVAAGTAPEGGWPVGIEDPADPDPPGAEPVVVIAHRAGAVATSSVRVRHWRSPDGTPVHHLVDPTTRAPARTGLLAVTVAAPDPAWAEVWTKALFLAGRRAIADEARARGIAAWWVDDRGRLGMTPGARVRTLWAREDRLG